MEKKNRILLYSTLFVLVSLFVIGIIYQKYYYKSNEEKDTEEIPEIKEEFTSISYTELRLYKDSNVYLDPNTKEIIRESNNYKYILGKYGKLYTSPIIEAIVEDNTDKYKKNEVHRFDKYSVYETDDNQYKYYILNRTNNKETDIFSDIYPIYYSDTENDECRYFILVNRTNDKNEYFVFDSNDESIVKFDDNIIDVNPGKSSVNGSAEDLSSIRNSLYLAVTTEDNKCGLVDYKNNYLIEPKYDELYVYNNSMMVAKSNGKFGIINSKDEILLSFEYDGIEIFDNYILVIKGNKIGILNKSYKIVVNYSIDYDNRMPFKYSLCCAESNAYYAQEDDDLIIQTVSSNDVFLEANNISREEYNKYVNYYVINSNGIYKKINGYELRISDKYIVISSIDKNNVIYTFYDYKYNKKSEFTMEIDHPELDFSVWGYNENKDYYSLNIYYPNNDEINEQNMYVDALNNKQVSNFDTEYNYFDNGYGYRINADKKQIEIYKEKELLSTTSNLESITYVGDYMFIVYDPNGIYKIIKVTFNKES